jgi:hypothetical protein
MGVSLHQTRQRNASATIQDMHTGRRRTARNAACQNQDVREVAAKRANVFDKQISRHRLSPIDAVSANVAP